jgi:hypothetical protein
LISFARGRFAGGLKSIDLQNAKWLFF